MIDKMCQEFQDWLERLPRQKLFPEFQQHVEVCKECRKRFSQFDPVVKKLAAVKSPKPLSENKLEEMARLVRRKVLQKENRRLAFRLSLVSLLCLPLIVSINWLWASLGYSLLSSYVSRILAYVFLVIFISGAAGMAGLLYGSIPLLVGRLRRQPCKEIAV